MAETHLLSGTNPMQVVTIDGLDPRSDDGTQAGTTTEVGRVGTTRRGNPGTGNERLARVLE